MKNRASSKINIECYGLNRGLAALLMALGVALATSLAAAPAELSDDADFYLQLVDYTQAFVDETADLTIEDVVANPDRFEPIATPYIDFGGVLKGRAWLKTSVTNTTTNESEWRFDINRQYYQALDVYIVRDGEQIEQIMQSRLTDSYHDRLVKDRMLGVDLTLAPAETLDIYLGMRAQASTFMPLGIGTVEAVAALHTKEHTINWFFNGALLTFVGFAMLLISVIGWRLALSFSLYVLAGFFYIFHADGYTFVHLWPNHMAINDPMNLTFIVMMPVFGLLFSRALFNFKRYAPVFDQFLLIYIFVAAIAAASSVLIYGSPTLKVIAYLLAPLGSVSQFFAGVIALRKKLLGAKPYFVGAIVIMSSFIYALLAHVRTGYFNHDTTLDFGHFALVTEGLAFIAAIATRLMGLQNERDKALESELAAVQDKLRLSSQLKRAQDDFIHARQMADKRRNQLSTVSHDLQQPLLSLRNALGKMAGSDEDAAQQMHNAFDYLEKLAREQLGADDIKAVDQALSSNIERFPINIVLDNVREMFADEAQGRGLAFRFKSMNAQVLADPVALMRALSNLVSNAIKHSPGSGFLLAARQRGDMIRIEVWDTGEGMSDAELALYLEPYQKSTESDGTGLGLAIVKSISDEHGFEFDLRSRIGRGTVACLYLPLGP